MADELLVLILAAGKGTRMKSDLVKVLHPILGQPMLAHVLTAVRTLGPTRIAVVIGDQAERVEGAFAGQDDLIFVRQEQQLGTGHAVASAREVLIKFHGAVLILYGDVPLLSKQTLYDFMAAHRAKGAAISVLTTKLADPGAYGRVILDNNGHLARIVEARDAGEDELAVNEINTGIYAVQAPLLVSLVDRLDRNNDQGEFYLTDIVGLARRDGLAVEAVASPRSEELFGVNNRLELAMAVSTLKERINRAWMEAGVTIIDPATTYVEPDVVLETDVTIWPGTFLMGRTRIGQGAEVGPDCQIVDSDIGPGASIKKGSILEGVQIPAGSTVPPLSVSES